MFDKSTSSELEQTKKANLESTEVLTNGNSGIVSNSEDDHRETSDQDAGMFLKYNFLANMALDVFASPLALASRENLPEGVVLLFIQEDVAVYGMETNNGLKIVVGMDDEMVRPKLLELFSRIHRCYIKAVCNPFSEVLGVRDCENMLQTDKFDSKIKDAILSI